MVGPGSRPADADLKRRTRLRRIQSRAADRWRTGPPSPTTPRRTGHASQPSQSGSRSLPAASTTGRGCEGADADAGLVAAGDPARDDRRLITVGLIDERLSDRVTVDLANLRRLEAARLHEALDDHVADAVNLAAGPHVIDFSQGVAAAPGSGPPHPGARSFARLGGDEFVVVLPDTARAKRSPGRPGSTSPTGSQPQPVSKTCTAASASPPPSVPPSRIRSLSSG